MPSLDGNIALTGGLDLSRGSEFTVGLAFGTTQHNALSTLAQSLSIPFEADSRGFHPPMGADIQAVCVDGGIGQAQALPTQRQSPARA